MKKYKVTTNIGVWCNDNIKSYNQYYQSTFNLMLKNKLTYFDLKDDCVCEIIEEEEPMKAIEKVIQAKERMDEVRNQLTKAVDTYEDTVKEFLNEKGIVGDEPEQKQYIHGDILITVARKSKELGYHYAIKLQKGELA